MTDFDSLHPRGDAGKFATKPVAEADIDSLIVHGEPVVERIQNVLRDAVNRGQLDGQAWIDQDKYGRPTLVFTDATDTEWAVYGDDRMMHVGLLGDEERFMVSDYSDKGWEHTVRALPGIVAKAQARRADHLAFTNLAQQYAEVATRDRRPFKVDERLAEIIVNDFRAEDRASLREFQSADPDHYFRPTARLRMARDDFHGADDFDYLIVAGPNENPVETRVYQDDQGYPLASWQASGVLNEASRRLGGDSDRFVPHFLTNAAAKSIESQTKTKEPTA